MEKEERKEQRKLRIKTRFDGGSSSSPDSWGASPTTASPGKSSTSLLYGSGSGSYGSDGLFINSPAVADRQIHQSGASQVAESLYALDKAKLKGLQEISDLRLSINKGESNHRDEDESMKRERLSKMQSEALGSAKANAVVEMKWTNLMTTEVPQELHDEIQKVILECKRIIKTKDNLIQGYQKQLYNKDTDYILAVKKQSKDVEQLILKMRDDFKSLEKVYGDQFSQIESAYGVEREKYLSDLTGEIDSLFTFRRDREISYKENRQIQEEEFLNEIDLCCTKGADQYNKLKTELELNLQTLSSQLQDIRSTYQLNSEKLDYNYRVLIELDLEKKNELSRYKKRFTKLKDQLNQSLFKFKELEASDNKLNSELTQDYRSLTQKYKNLQAKFRLFEASDGLKYDEIWKMHEEEVKDLLDHLLKADMLITEQQLGYSWLHPDIQCLQKILGKQGNMGTTSMLSSDESPLSNSQQNLSSSDGRGPPSRSSSRYEAKKHVSGKRVKAVLQLLAREAGFLLNHDVQESLNYVASEDADIERAEKMLKALGVKNEEQLRVLVDYFFKDTLPSTLDDDLGDDDVTDAELLLHHAPEDVSELRNIIKAEDVIRAVKAYLEDTSASDEKEARVGEDANVSNKRLNSMRNYWEQLSDVIPSGTCNVWKQLVRDYDTLKELLNSRRNTIADVDVLTERNSSLKTLLNQYLGDKEMDSSLQIPPTMTMAVNNIMGSPDRKGKSMYLRSPAGSPNKAHQKVLLSQTR